MLLVLLRPRFRDSVVLQSKHMFLLGHQSFDRLDVTVGAADAEANLKVSHKEADCYSRNEKPQARITDSKYYGAEFPLKRLADVDDRHG